MGRPACGRRLAALGLGALLALPIGEGAVRLALFATSGATTDRGGYSGEWTAHDPLLGWRPRPGARVRHHTTEFDIEIEIDAFGFRALPAHSATETPTQMVLLGDSFVFGQGVHAEETLGARMQAARADVVVMPMGVPGWGTDQACLAYRELDGPHRGADVVVLMYLPEHVARNLAHARHGRRKPWFELDGEGLVRRGVPVPLGVEEWRTDVDERRPGVAVPFKASLRRHSRLYCFLAARLGPVVRGVTGRDGDPYPEYAQDAPAWQVTRRLLARLRREVEARGASAVVAFVPEPGVPEVAAEVHRAAVHDACIDAGLGFLDLTPALQEAGAYYRLDGHWTPRGHAFAARALEEFLVREALLPPR